jgi:putative ABC transport system ATP-binding protein
MAVTHEAVVTSRVTTKPVLIELSGVHKVYRTGKLEYPALHGVDLAIEDGDMVAIVGPSGSGKSTIMNMITGIDRATSGTVTVDGQRIDQMSEEELAVWRGRRVGVVFQFFQLLPTLTALENAMLPLDFSRRVPKRERAPLRCTISSRSASPRRRTTSRRSCRAASSSGWRSLARWRRIRRC